MQGTFRVLSFLRILLWCGSRVCDWSFVTLPWPSTCAFVHSLLHSSSMPQCFPCPCCCGQPQSISILECFSSLDLTRTTSPLECLIAEIVAGTQCVGIEVFRLERQEASVAFSIGGQSGRGGEGLKNY